ncbi:DNA helicase-2/ATP-dependent DNA helicase PcrA [Arthrobacter woluwensis]|uniref:ATP-dependent helicase n=1 Tax=Arthrobacter woluwensis TaxID=156980 RepID=UPI00278920E0|nr:ATP-dependent DNA helicase [Arthrobacter woluwensis]MDQ0709431.1 DNA helicase-2/ATP-dependent DNA helicase PcrA [Arthrobacter woluwensis]
MTETTAAIISPEELAVLLGGNTPTEEQSRIIAAPLEPLLVIAGAGSGKTATMTDRVVWLVANGLVRPEEVLGVTFTRKAAGELAHRVRKALQQFAQVNQRLGMAPVELAVDELHEPRVSTYHSYANSLVSDFGLRLGIERDVTLMGPAQAWQLASQVVESYDGPMEYVEAAKSSLVNGVLKLAGECAEHLRPAVPGALAGSSQRLSVEEWVADLLSQYEALPPKVAGRAAETAARSLQTKFRTRVALARMVGRYAEVKRQRGLMDYGDLVALAATIAQDVPQARQLERDRSRVVILDEFQDTSHAQMVLFSELFGEGHAVTAVGDPNQSIYGFRGASAGQLFRFTEAFPRRRPDCGFEPSGTAYLTTAWRNGERILEVANRVAAPLSSASGAASVPELRPRPGAPAGAVVLARFADQYSEAAALADDVLSLRAPGRPARTMAVLCRKRSQMLPVQEAFELRGIPYEVIGLGGLLETPEIMDLTATLHVLADPGRSDKLMRLMAGARWRIGPADLMALQEWSSQLARRRSSRIREDAEEPDEDSALTPDPVDDSSLIEGLDFLPKPGWVSPAGRSLSPLGQQRLERLSEELRRLRGHLGHELVDLIAEVERAMLLDIEVEARAGRSLHSARRNLEAFTDQVLQFNRSNERVDLLAFLSWLEAAAREENGLAAAPPEPDPEAVQILTVHASKGLEWDAVFVPGLNTKDFPSERAAHWDVEIDTLPWPLRGDHASLPLWDTTEAGQAEWTRSAKLFAEEAKVHAVREERRLAYVAYTRAKDLLWVSSHAYATAGALRPMSDFLAELLPLAEDEDFPEVQLHGLSVGEEDIPDANPLTAQTRRSPWPYDPLEGPLDGETGQRRSMVAGRRAALEASAHAVLAALKPGEEVRPGRPGLTAAEPDGQHPVRTPQGEAWLEDAELLLAAQQRQPRRHEVRLPAHISASTLVELGTDAEAVARRLRRPVPREPGQAARKGTVFHGWVEEFFGQAGMLDLDEPLSEDAAFDAALGLDELVARFKASDWAHRTPAYLEAPVETSVGPLVVRGRIDAVFRDADGGWDLVDWKTGRAPRDAQDLARKSVQLAVYRLAWSRLRGVPLDSVRAAFYYVADGQEIRPHDLADAEELERIVSDALG